MRETIGLASKTDSTIPILRKNKISIYMEGKPLIITLAR